MTTPTMKQSIEAITNALPYGGKLRDTGHRDDAGRMVIYYADSAATIPQEARQKLLAEALPERPKDAGAPEDSAPAQGPWYGVIAKSLRQKQDDRLSFDTPAYIRDAFLEAARAYEATIPVVFRPLADAPQGTKPDLLFYAPNFLKNRDGITVLGLANLPNSGENVWVSKGRLPPEEQAELVATIKHELGHYFGLKHPEQSWGKHQLNANEADMSLLHGLSGMRGALDPSLPMAVVEALPGMYPVEETPALGIADHRALQQMYGRAPERALTPQGAFVRVEEKDGVLHADISALAQMPGVKGVHVAREDEDSKLWVFKEADDQYISVFDAKNIQHWHGTRLNDSFVGHREKAATFEGGDGSDTYIIGATDDGQVSHILDGEDSKVHLGKGSKVELHAAASSQTHIEVRFEVKSIDAQPTGDGRVTFTMHPARSGDKPAVFTMRTEGREGVKITHRVPNEESLFGNAPASLHVSFATGFHPDRDKGR